MPVKHFTAQVLKYSNSAESTPKVLKAVTQINYNFMILVVYPIQACIYTYVYNVHSNGVAYWCCVCVKNYFFCNLAPERRFVSFVVKLLAIILAHIL